MRDKQNIFYSTSLSPKTTPNDHDEIFIGYWLDMEIYVRVQVRSNIVRPEQVHKFPYLTNNLLITYALLSQ